MSKPKVLLWDIETGLQLATVFSLYNGDRLPYTSLQSERYIICASFKDLEGKKVSAVSVLDDPKRFAKDPTDDYYVVKKIHEIISDCDALIAHNGDNFDLKFFNGRALFHGLDPIPNGIIQIDTLKMARSKFKLNSNRLDYIGEYLGVGRKIDTNMQLWLDCLQGSKKAVREMIRYNKQDVLLLQDVYLKLAPHCPTKLNRNLWDNEACPTCGGNNWHQVKMRPTKTRWVRQVQCQDCGSYHSFTASEKEAKAILK